LIGPSQPPPDRLYERPVPLKSQLARFGLKWRLVRDESQLVLHERAERLGNEIELPAKLLVGLAQPVQPDPKPLVQFGGTAPFQPSTESIGEDRSLRRARLGCERFELLREVVGQIELVPRLEGLHRCYLGGVMRLGADAGGRTPVIFDESRSDFRS
jgi:hypothetical protein